jgi:hypothetical protein
MKKLIAAAALILSLSWADTLTLRNGRVVNGSYLGGDSRQVKMAVGDKVETYAVADVTRLEFGSLATSDATTPAPVPPPEPMPSTESGLRTSRTPPTSNAVARGVEIPAGTTITVRLIDPVDSRTDRLGQTYRASLDEPVMMNGDVIVPRGVDAVAKLVAAKQSGKMSGSTEMTIALDSITVDGRTIPVTTGEVTRASGSRAKKAGLMTGGVAAAGAIIGGLAGGGKGAAIGAVSGAGAGAAGSVLMKGEQVSIPSESRLTFSLDQSIRL